MFLRITTFPVWMQHGTDSGYVCNHTPHTDDSVLWIYTNTPTNNNGALRTLLKVSTDQYLRDIQQTTVNWGHVNKIFSYFEEISIIVPLLEEEKKCLTVFY